MIAIRSATLSATRSSKLPPSPISSRNCSSAADRRGSARAAASALCAPMPTRNSSVYASMRTVCSPAPSAYGVSRERVTPSRTVSLRALARATSCHPPSRHCTRRCFRDIARTARAAIVPTVPSRPSTSPSLQANSTPAITASSSGGAGAGALSAMQTDVGQPTITVGQPMAIGSSAPSASST